MQCITRGSVIVGSTPPFVIEAVLRYCSVATCITTVSLMETNPEEKSCQQNREIELLDMCGFLFTRWASNQLSHHTFLIHSVLKGSRHLCLQQNNCQHKNISNLAKYCCKDKDQQASGLHTKPCWPSVLTQPASLNFFRFHRWELSVIIAPFSNVGYKH